MKPAFLAHVRKTDSGEWIIHSLEDHLRSVGELSREMASKFNSGDWAFLAGLWHDLGKYRPAFQKYIADVSGFNADAHIENAPGRVDHSSAGAIYAIEQLPSAGRVLAYLIAGHHAGLPDWDSAEAAGSSLKVRLAEGKKKGYLEESLSNNPPEAILTTNSISSRPLGDSHAFHLWIRMLFSCLVDADFLDTEAFMSPQRANQRGHTFTMSELKALFDKFIDEKTRKAIDTPVNQLRKKVLSDCRQAAQNNEGIFTLSVPTGGGKTLSGMAFALEHAVQYKKSRIIVAIPYTSIIEQTAEQYRNIFGEAVLEHHSNLDSDTETSNSRLASENWDAPIIVTTNVQLFESLFSAKTSRCRKLHNIVNSVIILDEAQLIPTEFLQPILDSLRLLTQHYGVTLVLSTATQPALQSRKDAHQKTRLRGLDNATEIITDKTSLYNALERVNVHVPEDLSQTSSWEEVANQLMEYDTVLAIVNTRKDCRELYDLMPDGTIHLSALMCGQHRSEIIAHIKTALREKRPIRVISTQLVEAGVDFDFPVVFRALAGLDSIAQAAGRCNREGLLEKGDVFVFVPSNPPPKGLLRFGEQATRSVWSKLPSNPLSHTLFQSYFEQLYMLPNLDKNGIEQLLTKESKHGAVQFRSVAAKFKLIDDQGTYSVLVPYNADAEQLLKTLRYGETTKGLLRKLQRYSVTVYENEFRNLRELGAIEEIKPDIWVVFASNAYNQEKGLSFSRDLFTTTPSDTVF